MAITFIAATTAAADNVEDFILNKPAGTVEGHVMVALIARTDDLAEVFTPPVGWTLREEATDPLEVPFALHVYTKVAGPAEPASYTWSGTANRDHAGVIATYSGVDSTTPVHLDGVGFGRSNSISAPSITTTLPDLVVLAIGAQLVGTTVSTPAGTTSRAAVENPSGIEASFRLVEFAHPAPGATGAKVFTTAKVEEWIGYQVALLSANEPPNAPNVLSPQDGVVLDRAVSQRFDWDFSDPDTGDSQSKFDLDYRLVGAGAWTTVTQSTPTTHYDLPGGTLVAGDYEWRVRTYDSGGTVGAYSSTELFTAEDKPGAPTITYPVNGGDISQEEDEVTWSAPDQDDFQVRRVADAAGAPDTGTIYYNSGIIASTSTRQHDLTFETNNRVEHVQVRIREDGLWSDWASVLVNVAYTIPPVPTLLITAEPSVGRMVVAITNPAPGVGEPVFVSNDLYRSDDGVIFERIARDLAEDETYHDYTATAGIVYTYYVRTLGDNGTRSQSVNTDSPLLDLRGTWIHDPTDIAGTIHQFIYNDNGGDEDWAAEHSLEQYAGRTHPFAEFGTAEAYEVSVSLALEDDRADLEALRALTQLKKVLCYRDFRGRKLFTTLPAMPFNPARWGGRTRLRVVQIDHSEAV